MEEKLQPLKRSIPIFDAATGVVQVVREQPPEHCNLQIDSFSVLQDALFNSSKDHINSTEFKAGGYTWVLSVYPKGNKQEDGDGHLSLYVTLIDKLNSGTFVDASLRFFIHDQIRDNYLTFIDVGEKRFHDQKTAWGIPKALPLNSFTDASNGFLVNDCCVFGAGVLVRDGHIKRSAVSLLESQHDDRRYSWKIENFSDLNNKGLSSPVFSFGEWSWKLFLYPRGHNRAKGKHLSLYLKLVNANDLTHESSLYTQFRLCIKNQRCNGEDQEKVAYTWFPNESNDWGFTSFLPISDLYNASEDFLVDDTLIVEVTIQLMLLLKDRNPTPTPTPTPTKKIKSV